MSGRLIKSRKPRSKKMSNEEVHAKNTEAAAIETLKSKKEGSGILRIDRSLDGQSITIYIKHPLLADIIAEMTNGNAPAEEYAPIYKPILNLIPGFPNRAFSKPAVCKITKNFIADATWNWDAPRGVLVYNADKLREGYTLIHKVDMPVAPDTVRKWGKMFMDGCTDIIANAKAFHMTWVMKEKEMNAEDKAPVFLPQPMPEPEPGFLPPLVDDEEVPF